MLPAPTEVIIVEEVIVINIAASALARPPSGARETG
jgi:hypothetical protein